MRPAWYTIWKIRARAMNNRPQKEEKNNVGRMFESVQEFKDV